MVIALVITFAVAPLVNRLTSDTSEVVRLKNDVLRGTQISEEQLETVRVKTDTIPTGVITKSKDIVGKFASSNLYAGDYLKPEKLMGQSNTASDVLTTLNGSKMAVSVTIDTFASGLSGKLENGDIVSIYVTDKDGETTVPGELKYVKVITTTTAGGIDEAEVVPNEDGSFELPTTITVLVSVKQASILANYEENASMHVALVYRGDDAKAQQFLDAEDKFLATAKPANGGDSTNG